MSDYEDIDKSNPPRGKGRGPPRKRIDAIPDHPMPKRRKRPERSAIGKCTKYTLFFWNFFLFILGLAMTSLGSYILYIKGKVVHDALDFVLDPACDMTLAGAVMTFMAFFGGIGALREIVGCLKLYYMCLCVLLLGELALAVLMFVAYYVPNAKEQLFPSDTFESAIRNYRNDPDMQHLIDTLQGDLGCCGLSDAEDGFLDWQQNVYFDCTAANMSPEACSVPFSCCRPTENATIINYQCGGNMMKRIAGKVTGNTLNTYRIYTDGCIKALGTWIQTHSLTVGGVLLGVLLPQVFVVVLTRNLIEMILIQKSYW